MNDLKKLSWHYTKEQEDYIRNNYGKVHGKKIADVLGVKLKTLQIKARKMGLSSDLGKNYFAGKKHTKETLRKMSSGKLGKNNPFYGLKHKVSSKRKISFNSKKMWSDNYDRLCGSINNAVKKKSYRNNMSIALKKTWQRKSYRDKVTKAIRKGLCVLPNLPEKKLIRLIELNNLPFEYVGDGKYFIDGFNPDFLSFDGSMIIEIFGEYHHNLEEVVERDNRRRMAYKNNGKGLLIIWSKEIDETPHLVIGKIVKFLDG